MNRIRHNSPSPIQCLRAFHILFFAYLLFRCYCYNHYRTQKYYFCYRYRYFHTTLLLNTLLQILSYPGVVELTTQLLILENILWLPLCRINKFGLNTLPSKTVAIPYTCGLSVSSFEWFEWLDLAHVHACSWNKINIASTIFMFMVIYILLMLALIVG